MPEAADRPRVLSVLPPAFAEERLPVAYRMLRCTDISDLPAFRHATSEAYRTTAFACQPFHRPLSKLLRLG